MSARLKPVIRHLLLIVVLIGCGSAPAFAQTRVRVTAERASIWRPGFLTLATIVNRDTILDVVGRRGNWLEIVLPMSEPDQPQTGFIAVAQVTVINGSIGADATPAASGSTRPPSVIRPKARPVRRTGVRAFADAGYAQFHATDTFRAIFGRPGGGFYGGGGEFRLRDALFVQGAFRWFRQTGERVFVSGGETFPLGISDTLTLTPITLTVGARFPLRRVIVYAGGGVGRERVQETSAFADPSDNTDAHFNTYHVVAGVEWRHRGPVGIAAEAGYAAVRNALSGPVADAFKEHDLGSVDIRVRVLFGR